MFNKTAYCSLGLILMFVLSGCDSPLNLEGDIIQLENGSKMAIADDAKLSAEKREGIRLMAENLAVNYVNERHHGQAEIPGKVIDYFYNALVHFFTSDLDKVKEMIKHGVVVVSPPNAHEVIFWMYEQKPWFDRLRETKTSTGVPEIDELISRFNMSLVEFSDYSSGDLTASFILRSDRPVNVYAVGKLFSDLSQIKKATPRVYWTGGRDAKATVHDNYLLFDVTVGWGDCPAGCINRINRKFIITAKGEVGVAE